MLSGSKLKFQGVEFIREHLNAQGPDPLLEQWRKWLKVTASPAVSWNISFSVLGLVRHPWHRDAVLSSHPQALKWRSLPVETEQKESEQIEQKRAICIGHGATKKQTPYNIIIYILFCAKFHPESELTFWLKSNSCCPMSFSSLEYRSWTVFTRLHETSRYAWKGTQAEHFN